MSKIFRKVQSSFLLKLLLFSFLLGATHFYLFDSFFSNIPIFFPFWKIYAFNIIAVLLLFTVINYRYSIGKKMVFNTFMAGTLLKMVLAILFLLPLFLSIIENKKVDVINFFIPYFLFLTFEIYCLNSFLKSQ